MKKLVVLFLFLFIFLFNNQLGLCSYASRHSDQSDFLSELVVFAVIGLILNVVIYVVKSVNNFFKSNFDENILKEQQNNKNMD